MLYKCLYSHGTPYISNVFNVKNLKYNLRGLGTRLELPHSTWSVCIDVTFLVGKLWNALPPLVRESKDILSFKWALKVHMN